MSSLDVRSIDESGLRHEKAPATKQEFRVLLSEQAFDRAVARGDGDTTREIGGVLVGELLRDDAGPYLRIDGTIDALHAEEKGAEVTFTHATWEHIHKEMDTKHQNKRVVGWYHTHPGFGIFLSDRDQFIHKSFFNLPFQVALVYDPKTHEHGMFTWHDNEVRRARRYWIGAREQSWDGPRVAGEPVDRTPIKLGIDERAPKVTESREDMSLTGWIGPLIIVGITLLIIGGFVGHWWSAGAVGQVQAEAQLEIAKAKSEGVQLTIASLQSDLLAVLRDTLGDEALHRPVMQAIAEIDAALAVLPTDSAAAPADGKAAASTAAPGSDCDARLGQLAGQLRGTRGNLLRIGESRGTALAELSRLEHMARSGGPQRADLGRDVAEQRSGLGALYSELANDAVKAHDLPRARRLLATAAHFDPRNRTRYEKQLQSFDPSAVLPPDNIDNAGSTGEGPTR
jgi:proteasome lid subunit RPN8/RPN11